MRGTWGIRYAITQGPDKLRLRRQHDNDRRLITAPRLDSPENDSLSYREGMLCGRIVTHGDLSALDTNVVVMQILDAARESARTEIDEVDLSEVTSTELTLPVSLP